jgi:hypothetical protein
MLTGQEQVDQARARAVALGAALDTFRTALAAAQTSMAALNTTVQADGGAAGGTKTASTATAALVAALSIATPSSYCSY